MIITVHAGGVTFDDRHNFRAFKVVVETSSAGLVEVAAALNGIATVPDRETAWVSAAALRNWDGVRDDAAWQQGFAAMIEKAKPHGWINEADNTIKAHIEWPA
jgi:hypothetical protein